MTKIATQETASKDSCWATDPYCSKRLPHSPRRYDLPMENIPKTRLIRQYIRNALLQFGECSSASVLETLLIRDGVYCGHRFRRDPYQAVWFVEENQVKFYGPRGELLETFDAGQVTQPYSPKAA